jgi:protein-disulfide isomerase
MGVNGTPHFLVGDRSIPGAPENLYEQLSTHVDELRKQGCSFC